MSKRPPASAWLASQLPVYLCREIAGDSEEVTEFCSGSRDVVLSAVAAAAERRPRVGSRFSELSWSRTAGSSMAVKKRWVRTMSSNLIRGCLSPWWALGRFPGRAVTRSGTAKHLFLRQFRSRSATTTEINLSRIAVKLLCFTPVDSSIYRRRRGARCGEYLAPCRAARRLRGLRYPANVAGVQGHFCPRGMSSRTHCTPEEISDDLIRHTVLLIDRRLRRATTCASP